MRGCKCLAGDWAMPLKDYECFPVAPPSYPLELSSFIPDTITSW